MRIVSVVSVGVGLAFVLACGGANVDTTPIPWDGPEVVLPSTTETVELTETAETPSPEAVQPEVVAEAEAVVAAVAAATAEEEAVNKPVGAEEAVPEPVAVAAPAPAPVAVGVGQIQLTTGAGIQPLVDGVPMRLTASQGFLSEVSAGKHSLEIRNLLGNVTGSAEVDVAGGRRTRYEWRRRNLTLLGDVASSTMPAAIDWDEVFEGDDAGNTGGDDKGPLQPAAATGGKK